MFTLFGFGGNFIFAIIALTMIKKLRRDLYERSGLMPITAILRVVNIFSLIIFGIMIIFFLIGAAITELPIELLPAEIIESFF